MFNLQNALTRSEEVATVIGLRTHAASGGASASLERTTDRTSYSGSFGPQCHGPTTAPYEKFTAQIPSGLEKGPARIRVIYLTLNAVSSVH
ncbi:hypothetical protein EV401DRAFT_645018 [Pisolithus croceorrhizus]|nr:hypothetical protein EV401DRAFT_645018 [Pisolithus croceorrhizus]